LLTSLIQPFHCLPNKTHFPFHLFHKFIEGSELSILIPDSSGCDFS
jgi:hypothetical protein